MNKAPVRAALCLLLLIVFSTSASAQWIQTNWPASTGFFNLYIHQDMVFARTWDTLNGGRMFLSANNGGSWTQIGSAESDLDILTIVMSDNTILAGTWNGISLSTSGGASWNAVTPAGIPADTAIRSIAAIGTALFAGTSGHVYKSSDNGNAWTDASSGIPANAAITSFAANANAIFAGSDSNGVFKTTNNGTSWTVVNSGLTDTRISQLVTVNARLFAVTLKGVFISENDGTSWAADSSGLKNINCFVVVNNRLYAGTDASGVYSSVDDGRTWTSTNAPMPEDTRVWSLAANSGNIFAGTSAGVWRMPIDTILGDTNGDSRIDIIDALRIAQHYVGLTPAGFIASNADVNCSGAVDIVDALLVAQFYVGLMSSFPC